MNDLLTKNDLTELIQVRDTHNVSVYLPTHVIGTEAMQDPIRLRNLLDEAETTLRSRGMRRVDAVERLAPARSLADDRLFWQNQSHGLALFLSPEGMIRYRLPFAFEPLVQVGNRFHIKPLLPLLNSDGRFYVLAVSQKAVRILQATRFHVDEIELESLPRSLAAALAYDDPERQLQSHMGAQAGAFRGGNTAIFHGHGGGSDDQKRELMQFFRQIDAGLRDLHETEPSPLVLAAVGYLHPIFAEASNYPNLVAEGVDGNPDDLSDEALHQAAWKVVEPIFSQQKEDAMARYRNLLGTDRSSDRIEEIVPAAHMGRIESVFVPTGLHIWGTFAPENFKVVEARAPGADNEDLLDLTAVQTLLHDGQVYVMAPDEIPGDSLVAATFRYELKRSL